MAFQIVTRDADHAPASNCARGRSVEMPTADTKLSNLLAPDDTAGVRGCPQHHRRPPAPGLRPTDPDLARVVDAWPTLPRSIRSGVLAMIKAQREQG